MNRKSILESTFMIVFMCVSLLSAIGGLIYIVYTVLRVIYTLISSYISAKEKGDFKLQGNIPDSSKV